MVNDVRLKLALSVSKIDKPGDSRWNRWLKNPSIEIKEFYLKPGKAAPKEIKLNFLFPEVSDYSRIIPQQGLIYRKAFEKFLKLRATKTYNSTLLVSKTYRLFFSVLQTQCSDNLIPVFTSIPIQYEKIFSKEIDDTLTHFIIYSQATPDVSDLTGVFSFKIKQYPDYTDNSFFSGIQIASRDSSDLPENPWINEWQYFDESFITQNLLQSYQDIIALDKSDDGLIKPSEISVSLLPGTSIIYVSLLSIKDFDISTKEIKNIEVVSSHSPVKIIYGSVGPKKTYSKKVYPVTGKVAAFEFTQIESADISPDYFEYKPINAVNVVDLNSRIFFNSRLIKKSSDDGTLSRDINLIEANDFVSNPVLAVPEKKKAQIFKDNIIITRMELIFLLTIPLLYLPYEPGLGKNTQIVKSLKILFRKGTIKNALIICNKQDLGNSQLSSRSFSIEGWEGAFYFWAPEIKFSNNEEKSQITFAFNEEIVNNEDSFVSRFQKARFDCIVLDKKNISDINSIFFREIRKLYPKYLWITSSLFEEEAQKLISLYYEEKHLTEQEIKDKLNWVYLRRKKASLTKDLPVKLETNKWFFLSGKQKIEYDSTLFQGEIKIYSTLEKGNIYIIRPHIFTLLHQLLQVCNFSADEKESGKSKYLIDFISHTTDKIIVFSQYEKFGIDRLSMLLEEKNIKHITIKTNTTSNIQAKLLDNFEKSDDVKVLLADAKAINRRLNLKQFVTVVHFDSWWNPAVKWQTEDKIRTSPGYPISIYNLITKDTIHEKIYSILSEKGLYVKSILGQLSVNFISELISTEEWLNMLGVKALESEEQDKKASKEKNIFHENFSERVKKFFGFLGYKKIKSNDQDAKKNIIIFSKVNNTYEETILVQYKQIDIITQEELVKFYGAISGYKNISHFYLVSSGEFSPECRKYLISTAENITLIDGKKIEYFFSIFR